MPNIAFAPAPVQRNSPIVDPNDIAARQALAEALSQGSNGIQQVKSPWQGLAQVSDSIFGALGEKKAAADKAQNAKFLAEALSGQASGQPMSADKLNMVMALNPELGQQILQDQQAKTEEAANRSRAADALTSAGLTQQAEAVRSGVISVDEAGKMLEQAYTPAKPDIREVGGNLVSIGPDQQTSTIYSSPDAGSKPPVGYRPTEDGNLAFIPGGPADPSTAGKTTEATRRNQQLAKVIVPELNSLLGDGTKPGTFDALSNAWSQGLDAMGPVGLVVGGGPAQEYQQAKNSLKTIIASYLYSVSGATANPGEVETQASVLTPKPGEPAASIADKKRRIATMVQAVVDAAKGTPIDMNTLDQPQGSPPAPGGAPGGGLGTGNVDDLVTKYLGQP